MISTPSSSPSPGKPGKGPQQPQNPQSTAIGGLRDFARSRVVAFGLGLLTYAALENFVGEDVEKDPKKGRGQAQREKVKTVCPEPDLELVCTDYCKDQQVTPEEDSANGDDEAIMSATNANIQQVLEGDTSDDEVKREAAPDKIDTAEKLRRLINIGGADVPEIPNLREKIEEAKDLLERNKVKGKYTVALLDHRGRIHIRNTSQKALTRTKKNGVNSQYKIDGHSDWIVIGNTTPAGTYYVPYSSALDTPQVREDGAKYMAEVIFKAKEELRRRNVKSHVEPGKLVADLYPPELIAQLLIIEHLDPKPFFRALDSGDDARIKREYNKVLVSVGLNKERTYSTNTSVKSATGFAQFIKPTYDGVVGLYPEAGLHEEYLPGMADHVNAAMAQQCLLDNELLSVPKARRKVYLQDKFSYAKLLYLTAGYNCNPRHVNKQIETYGADWTKHLPAETERYLRKRAEVAKLQKKNY